VEGGPEGPVVDETVPTGSSLPNNHTSAQHPLSLDGTVPPAGLSVPDATDRSTQDYNHGIDPTDLQQNVSMRSILPMTFLASLGGILFGYDLGVIASALPQLIAAFDLTSQQAELVVAILYVGGGLGAVVGGSLCDAMGRKATILLTDVLFAIAATILALATSVGALIVGRISVGFAVAVSGIADVSYLHEIAPSNVRGSLVSVNEACISLGFLLAFVVGTLCSDMSSNTAANSEDLTDDFNDPGNRLLEDGQQQDENVDPGNGWRIMFGLSGVIALIQFSGMWFMPESPVWLAEQRHRRRREGDRRHFASAQTIPVDETFTADSSTTAVRRLSPPSYDTNTVGQGSTAACAPPIDGRIPHEHGYGHYSSYHDSFVRRPLAAACRQKSLFQQQLQGYLAFLRQLFSPYYRRQTSIALFLAVTQQFCGQTNVLSYAPMIFAVALDSSSSDSTLTAAGWSTVLIGAVKFVITVLVIWKVEVFGRRPLLIVGMTVIAMGLVLLTLAFESAPEAAEAGGGSGENASKLSKSSLHGFELAMPGVLLVVSGYSMSFGPLTWLLTSELFETDIRGRALGFGTIVTYMSAAMVTYTFLSAQDWIGPGRVFAIYLLVTCLGILFAYTAIPDTKEKSVEEIRLSLDRMLWWQGSSLFSWKRRPSTSSSGATGDASPLFGSLETHPSESELPRLA